jgi:hypothetical protein
MVDCGGLGDGCGMWVMRGAVMVRVNLPFAGHSASFTSQCLKSQKHLKTLHVLRSFNL